MARPKKESQQVAIRMEKSIFDRLEQYCSDSGQSKTLAIERAVAAYIDDYEKMMKKVNK